MTVVKEFHNDFMHFVIDCKTGNKIIDERVENAIKGYVHMVVYALEDGRANELFHKSRSLAIELSGKTVNKK
jgi:hypothetical protein